jgi:dihydroorotase
MANTLPVNDCAAITRSIVARAAETAACRVYPVGAITRGLQGRELAEIGGMIEAGAVALSDDGLPVTDSSLMRRALEYARSFGVAILSHAEDLHLSSGGCMHEGSDSFRLGLPGIPAASEEIAVARDIALCRFTGARLHLAHLSTREAIEQVRRAKRDGLPVTAEVTPHHLRLTAETWQGYSTFCKMNPPLRTAGDTAALIEALADGTIDLIATDHAPHALHEKSLDALAAPNGVIGLQTAVPLTLAPVFSGRIPLLRWVRSLTEAPARLLGIPGGRLTRGAPSDLCVIDPNERWSWSPESNRSKSPNLPPLHEAGIHSFQGRVILTFVGGRLAFDGRTNPTEARS